jgi:colanic acid/amylovoran biosynthesis glycosyltransferase
MEKPTVLIYRDHLLPYSETFILKQAQGLNRFNYLFAGSKFVNGLHLPSERALAVNSGSRLGKIKEIKAKLFGFPESFIQAVKKFGPSLVHAHFGPDGFTALPIAKRLGVPLIVTFHGYDVTTKDEYASSFSHRRYIRSRQKLIREGNLFLAISEFIKEKLIFQGFPEEKIVVHYTGVDVNFFHPDPSVEREPVVLFVGRLVENKGCQYLIRAMQAVQQNNPDVELVIIGEGPLEEPLKKQAEGCLNKYRFLGPLPLEEVQRWMNRAKVLCVPSVEIKTGASEGIGTVFLEAQAMGLPVVSFATGGIPEAVSHGETGFLAPEKNVDLLSRYIGMLLEDDDLWKEISFRGRERVEKKFDLNKNNRILEDLYMKCMNDFRRRVDPRENRFDERMIHSKESASI